MARLEYKKVCRECSEIFVTEDNQDVICVGCLGEWIDCHDDDSKLTTEMIEDKLHNWPTWEEREAS